ncbi:MAG: M48 family peptidase [Alphaproteobacteria bacterium]|nr:M48 family peptidase [Alphaproteobacteria bacterium]
MGRCPSGQGQRLGAPDSARDGPVQGSGGNPTRSRSGQEIAAAETSLAAASFAKLLQSNSPRRGRRAGFFEWLLALRPVTLRNYRRRTRNDPGQLALPLEAPPVHSAPRKLGTVAAVVLAWGLSDRLARAEKIGRGYDECLGARVTSSRRAKVSAGVAYIAERRIVLNAALLTPGHEADRDATFLHECAHIIADVRYQRNCRHGAGWRRVMETLGEPAVAHHAIDYLSHAANAVLTWVCVRCGGEYHFVRRPRRQIDECHCRRCGPKLGRLAVRTPFATKR